MRFQFAALAFGLTAAVAFALVVSGEVASPRPAYACSGSAGELALDRYIRDADAIAYVAVDSVGGAENTMPPLPPGTQPDQPGAGPGSIPEGFDFEGFGVNATVLDVLLGDLPASIEFDWQLREGLEATARQAEAGGIVPCFFGLQDRYQADRVYFVFLERIDGGWQTLDAYQVFHLLINGAAAGIEELGGGRMFVSGDLYSRFFSGVDATLTEGETEFGELWRIEQSEVHPSSVIEAIRALRSESTVRPPSTGSGGLVDAD